MIYLKELKKIMWSIPYLLFTAIVAVALYSQGVFDFGGEKVLQPQPDESYGTQNVEIPELIMPAALESLYAEFQENQYRTYPIGLLKNVKLNENEQAQIAEILSQITGLDANELYRHGETSCDDGTLSFQIGGNGNLQTEEDGSFTISMDDAVTTDDTPGLPPHLTVRADLTYAEFKALMQKADDLLGGGSDYAMDALIGFGTVPLTYEEALTRYELMKTHDRITGGYARLFSDYAVAMTLAVLPVFLAVILGMKDRSVKMSELVYIRKSSGAKIIFARFAALLTAVMLPVIVLSYLSNMSVWGTYPGMDMDYLAPLKYDLGYIMPSAMAAIAVGMCLTELTNTPIAVAVQGLWWFVDLNIGFRSVSASYALFRLAPRHNAGGQSYFRTQDFIDNFPRLFANRLLFAGMSLLLVIATVVIFEANRKGQFHANHPFKKTSARLRNRQNPS